MIVRGKETEMQNGAKEHLGLCVCDQLYMTRHIHVYIDHYLEIVEHML